MSISRKYGRTYHYPFSPGTTSDDRINHSYWDDISKIHKILHTEKLDGENTCISKIGVFARSHAAPTTHPWSNYLKERWALIKNDIGGLEVFGENIYAVHSIIYPDIESHFYVFGIREADKWLSWDEVKFYSTLLDFQTVPEIKIVKPVVQREFENDILEAVKGRGRFGSVDVHTGNQCTMEGIVSRNVEEYPVSEFNKNVFKWVRKGHVKTDDVHWTRNWKRASLKCEKKNDEQ
jgi:hypothetical protein